MPISMNSHSASIVATPAGADCSSSASCSTRSLHHPLDIGLHALAVQRKTATGSGHCTQAATPLVELPSTAHYLHLPLDLNFLLCSGTLTFWNSRIGRIRPLIRLGLRDGF